MLTPSLQHAEPLRRSTRQRLRLQMSFGRVVVLSAALHVMAFAALAFLSASPAETVLSVYTVRVLEIGSGPASNGVRQPPVSRPKPQGTPTSSDAQDVATAATDPEDEVAAQAQDADPVAAPTSAKAPTSPVPTAAAANSAGALSAVDAESLDAGFALLTPVQMGYPDAALRARKTGRVRLEVEIGPDGRVLNVRVLESTPGWGFEESARNAYAQARFSPPRWQGRPVRVLWRKTLLFQP